MTSVELDTQAEVVMLVRDIVRRTIADARLKQLAGFDLKPIDVAAQKLDERLSLGYSLKVTLERKGE